jgi:DNA modification methylase
MIVKENMNKIINEDYNITLSKLSNVKIVITSPPDSDEIGLKPNADEYHKFLKDFCANITQTSNLVCVIITDRKNNGIMSKHSDMILNFKENGFRLLAHKIWKKSDKINLYRLTYSHIMVFTNAKVKQKHEREFELDIWENAQESYEGYANTFPLEIIRKIIRNFTDSDDLVYDPFMGSGTTALACIMEDRHYIGSELNRQNYNMCMKRMSEHD